VKGTSPSSSSNDGGSTHQCGGIAGLTCPANQHCVDDPSDSCDPNAGGRDCIGICVN
jgi:hypothetical protein